MALYPLPQNGIEPTMIEPPSIDHLYRDPDYTLPVVIAIVPARSGDPTDNHWMLIWTVYSSIQTGYIVRRLQVAQEQGFNHLTNWGALTVTAGTLTTTAQKFSVGEMTLSQRKHLERIALGTQVMMPNGQWNCQNWITAVLKEAVNQYLLDGRIVDQALYAARQVQPHSTSSWY